MKLQKYEKYIEPLFVIFTVILLFYWSYLIYQTNLVSIENKKIERMEKYYKISRLVEQVLNKEKKGTSHLRLKGSLLSNFQRIAKIDNLAGKILSIKPDTLTKKENIKVRLESLYYKEVLKLIQDIERYSNIEIKNLLIRKRFDDPELADMSIMLIKMD